MISQDTTIKVNSSGHCKAGGVIGGQFGVEGHLFEACSDGRDVGGIPVGYKSVTPRGRLGPLELMLGGRWWDVVAGDDIETGLDAALSNDADGPGGGEGGLWV